jgi:endonuclease/exonuclease/phosphatase (EEP) superfamily protein YafD
VVLGLFLMLVALAATLLCALAPRFWVSDLAVHFRLQYVLVALAACLILAVTGHGYWATLSFLIAAVQALICAPLVNAPAVPTAPSAAASVAAFRVAALNVWYRNRHFQRVSDFAARESPDVILLAEVTAECEAALSALTEEYAHRFSTRGNRGTGLLLLSRWPMQAAVLPDFSEVEPAIAATLVIKERRVQLLSVHTSWPIGRQCTVERDRQLAMVGAYARAQEGPLIVLGDLNISPFSRVFQELLSGSHLSSAAQGFGWQPTWPVFLPPAGIQIDHALVSAGVAVMSFRRGAPVGSDHLPILVDCAL